MITGFYPCFNRMELTKLEKFRAPEMAQTAVLELLDSSKLISRKILVTEISTP